FAGHCRNCCGISDWFSISTFLVGNLAVHSRRFHLYCRFGFAAGTSKGSRTNKIVGPVNCTDQRHWTDVDIEGTWLVLSYSTSKELERIVNPGAESSDDAL